MTRKEINAIIEANPNIETAFKVLREIIQPSAKPKHWTVGEIRKWINDLPSSQDASPIGAVMDGRFVERIEVYAFGEDEAPDVYVTGKE